MYIGEILVVIGVGAGRDVSNDVCGELCRCLSMMTAT